MNIGPKKLCVIIPVYNESINITNVINDFSTLQNNNFLFSLLFIDDGSSDDTVSVLENAESKSSSVEVNYISLSRNFGKEAAIMAGLNYVSQKHVGAIIMDGDGQHKAEDAVLLADTAQEKGVDICFGVRENRSYQSSLSRLISNTFYVIFNIFSKNKLKNEIGDFNYLSSKVVCAFKDIGEYHLFMKALWQWVGFSCTVVPIKIHDRDGGETKFSFFKSLKLSANGIISFSSWPIRVWFLLGFTIFMISIFMVIHTLYNYSVNGVEVPGYTSLFIMVLSLGGVQLLALGIIGEYIGRVYEEVKKRPRYLVKQQSLKESFDED